jgi:hypothetical protein
MIIVIAHKYIGIWKIKNLPEFVVKIYKTSDANKAPNVVGKENAKRLSKAEEQKVKEAAIYWLEPKEIKLSISDKGEGRLLELESYQILNFIKNSDANRLQVNPRNFIDTIEQLKQFFENPIDAVHCFYTIVAYWDITSKVAKNDAKGKIAVVGFSGHKFSEDIEIKPKHYNSFTKFIETRYVFTNEGSGKTVDYYFSRFDEVMARINPEYVKQHGIFFTDINLSRFALWFVKEKLSEELDEKYIFFDPAGGSGNLISSWHIKKQLKHKIISELQPDLLRTIERRMNADVFHLETGFTIIPRTSLNEGLNFLDKSAEEYLDILETDLNRQGVKIDKALAFLLNPPYKNTDENEQVREDSESNYTVHSSITELTGEDAAKERYLSFLSQILNISKYQVSKHKDFEPVVMVFTPTSWLIPRPSYIEFRKVWDKHFEYLDGFIITSNEFFKLQGKWPLSFTIWKYKPDDKRKNNIKLFDYSSLSKDSLDVNWALEDAELKFSLKDILKGLKQIKYSNRGDIRESLPIIKKYKADGDFEEMNQPRYDYSTAKKDKDFDKIISGFPLADKDRHFILKRKCGKVDGEFIGLMDDLTPVRVEQDSCRRLSNKSDRVWFRLDNVFININQTKVLNGPSDNRSFCAYDLESAKSTFSWFCITKILNGAYPIWANQFDIWAPSISKEKESLWFALCFSFVLSENRCIISKFEKDNPVKGAYELFLDNPLSPVNSEAFWMEYLDKHVKKEHINAFALVKAIKELYKFWNLEYCKGKTIENVGLENESYFKYFDYADFLTPHSGLVQLRKYAEINNVSELTKRFENISALTKAVKEELYKLLVIDFKYFD